MSIHTQRRFMVCAHRWTMLVALLGMCLFLPTGQAKAETVVDQSFTSPTDLGSGINECCAYIAQTFTVGISGTLVGVNVDVYEAGPFITSKLNVAIHTVENGEPTWTVMESTTLDVAGSPLTDYVSFANGVSVTEGEQYAIVVNYVNAPPPGGGQEQGVWLGATTNEYPGGKTTAYTGTYWNDAGGAYDLHFRTYVEPLPADDDGDGFDVNSDCDDSDPTVYPGALEVKHDGIDQDCNGYDLTIDITEAEYRTNKDSLTVKATSSLGSGADLQVAGYGLMQWQANKATWALTVSPAGGDPGAVTVCGIEGCDTAQTTVK